MTKTAQARNIPAAGRQELMQVPLLDLKRQYASIRDAVQEAIARVCDSQHFILGREGRAFENEIAALTGASHAVGCASGTDALWLALVACGVRGGDSVITSPFSFFASASSIVRAGARPYFADIDPRTLNLDPVQLERRLKKGGMKDLRAVQPVHLYGQCADMDAILNLTNERKLAVVEDAAQAIGATWRGRRAGSLGNAAAFSFYPTKNLSAFGDAGCVTTNDDAVAEHIRRLRNHGGHERYYHDEIGANSRLDEIQAAVMRVKLKYLPQWNRKRAEHAENYVRLLRDAGLVGAASPVTLLSTLSEAGHIYHQFVIRAQRRDELRKFLADHGVGTEIYYPVPLHLQKCFAWLGYAEGDMPEAERAAKEVLALPIFPEITAEEQQYVVERVAEFYS